MYTTHRTFNTVWISKQNLSLSQLTVFCSDDQRGKERNAIWVEEPRHVALGLCAMINHNLKVPGLQSTNPAAIYDKLSTFSLLEEHFRGSTF